MPAPLTDSSHPPIPPRIPLEAINSLIPRLTTTINDIDSFKSLLAAGDADGSMPDWDALLQRYSLFLGRIHALSTYLAQPPPPPPGPRPRPPPPTTPPALTRYIVHPFNPLASSDSGLNPLAEGTFFQAINTQPLPSESSTTHSLLSTDPWIPLGRLRKMDEGSLARLGEGLRERLGREKNMADAVREEIGRREEEVDWGMRIVVGDEGTEGDGEGGGDGEDDLFGEDEDEEMGGEGKKVGDQAKGQGEGEGLWNPREGWTVVDYVRFMESGKQPEPARPEPEAPRTDPWPDLSSSITD